MLPVSGYLRNVILWAMVPLTVSAGGPVTGCTCSSGEHKFFCAAHLQRHTSRQATKAGLVCQKPCSQERDRDLGSAPCCRRGCALSTGDGRTSDSNCCNPDTLVPITVATGVAFRFDFNDHSLFDLPAAENSGVFANLGIDLAVSHDIGPPGGDLVISLRRLLV
jgi:hypothetical protein